MAESENNKQNTIYNRLGYGSLDVTIGDKWLACDDVVNHTFIGHPEQDSKSCVRKLLALLGKRFPTQEATLIWNEIENYRQGLAQTFGPPDAAKTASLISFEQAARSWYEQEGRIFEKNWCLRAPFDFHYAHTSAHESVEGRWVRWLHPDLQQFAEAGFDPFKILSVLRLYYPGDWWTLFKLKRELVGEDLQFLWVKMAAHLMSFRLTEKGVQQARTEILRHQEFLQTDQKRAVTFAQATLNYFCRLERAGLDARVIETPARRVFMAKNRPAFS